MGIPVVISNNGFGLPVNPVEGNFPTMTVSANGNGLPIIISENGVPFIVQGYEPESEAPEEDE